MTVAAAERVVFDDQSVTMEQTPLVIAVPEMAEDQVIRSRAARFIGACALSGEVALPDHETQLTVSPVESLYDGIQKAAEGDPEAYKMVQINVRTDVVERTIKAGHVNKVDLMVDAAGRIQQHGQSMQSVQANSLRFAADSRQMRQRTEAETRNSFRIEELYKNGALKDYYFVVFSRAADNMSHADMKKAGFFTDTMTCMVQVTTEESGQLSTESVSLAGVAKKGGTRHDAEMVRGVGQRFGYDLSGQTAAETIDTPLLVHKSLAPNGGIDFAKIADEETPGETFFGEDRPQQDYLQYLELCRQKEQQYQPKVNEITNKLVGQAGYIKDRLQAVRALHKLSEASMVDQAIGDDDINPNVFGEVAAVHIEEARRQLERGNYEAALTYRSRAIKTADSSSCPSALKSSLAPSEDVESGSATDKECTFVSKECPKCHKKNVLTTVTKHGISGDCGCKASK